MTDLVWDAVGQREYETGVFKGILFPYMSRSVGFSSTIGPSHQLVGVPWNGLTNVTVNVSGGEAESYYFDGQKYMDATLAQDFQATITAMATPKEFRPMEGIYEPVSGMQVPFNQRHKFAVSWRTRIGNDLLATDFAYKIHVVYNAVVDPNERAYQTLDDTPAPDTRTWVIRATPACFRSAYFVFDSRDGDLSALEAQLDAGILPNCSDLPSLVGAGGGGGGGPTTCPTYLEDFESYDPGTIVNQSNNDAPSFRVANVIGLINSGVDTTEYKTGSTFTVNDSTATETGSGAILADDDVTTYVSSVHGDMGFTFDLPPLVGYSSGCDFELHISLSLSGDVDPDDPDNVDADAQVFITTDATGDTAVGGFSDGTDDGLGFAITQVDGSVQDLVIPLNMDPWTDQTIDDVAAALASGAYLNVVGITNNNPDPAASPVATIYEMSIVMIDNTQGTGFLRPYIDSDGFYNNGQAISAQMTSSALTTGSNAQHFSTVDFLARQIPFDANVAGFNCPVLGQTTADTVRWANNVTVKIDADHNLVVAAFQGLDNVATSTPRGVAQINPDMWYTALSQWFTDGICRVQVMEKDSGAIVLQHTNTATETPPVVAVRDEANWAGDDTVSYEVDIDNVYIEVDCQNVMDETAWEEIPVVTPPPIVIDVPLTKYLRIEYAEDGTSTSISHTDFPIVWDITRYADPAFNHVQPTFVYPQEWDGHGSSTLDMVPATPAGYALHDVKYVMSAHLEGGAATSITDDTSSWGYNPGPTKSPYIVVHNGSSASPTFDGTWSTSGDMEAVSGPVPSSISTGVFAEAFSLEKWYGGADALGSPPYPADARTVKATSVHLRFTFNPM